MKRLIIIMAILIGLVSGNISKIVGEVVELATPKVEVVLAMPPNFTFTYLSTKQEYCESVNQSVNRTSDPVIPRVRTNYDDTS